MGADDDLCGPVGAHDEQSRGGAAPNEIAKPVDRRPITVVQVLDDQQQDLGGDDLQRIRDLVGHSHGVDPAR